MKSSTKVLITIWDQSLGLSVCVCVHVTGLQAVQYDQIMRWWGSNLGQVLIHPYNLSLIVV